MAGEGARSSARARRVAVAAVIVVALGVIVASVRSASAGTHHASATDEHRFVALVTGVGSDELVPVDLSTTPPVADTPVQLPATRAPKQLAVVGNRTAYVLGQDTNNITVVDLTGAHVAVTGRFALPTVAAPTWNVPTGLAVAPDGRRALVSYGLLSIAVAIDLTKNPPVSTVLQLPGQASAPAVTPDGRTALLFTGDGTIARVYLDANPPALLSPIRLTQRSGCGIAIAPDGKVAIATSGLNNAANVIDLTKNPPVAVPVALPSDYPCYVTIAPDSKTAYIANMQGDTVTPLALDTTPPTVRPTIGLNGGRYPRGIAVTPDGKRLIVVNTNTSDVTPIDLTTNPPRPGARVGLAGARDATGVAIVSLRVRPGQATTTTLTSNLARPLARQPVTFTATVSGTSAEPVGAVTFLVDGHVVGSPVALHDGTARLTLDSLGAGARRVTARYSGDLDFKPSSRDLTQTVDQTATSTAVTASVNRSVPGQWVVVSAAVSTVAPGRGVPTGTVTFKLDDRALGQPVPLTNAANASVLLPRLAPGPHKVSATYNGDANHRASTTPLVPDLDVVAATTKVALSVEPSRPAPDALTVLVARVGVDAPGTGVPQGTVAFTVDGAAVGAPVTLVDGQAHVTFQFSPGRHRVSAAYGGATDFKSANGDLDVDVG